MDTGQRELLTNEQWEGEENLTRDVHWLAYIMLSLSEYSIG